MRSNLQACGFEENTLNLLSFYLTDRQNSSSQPSSVTINWHTVNRWCPKGSAIGPLLWNIFENDLTYEIKLDFSTYADDHQLHEMGEDLAKVKSSHTVSYNHISFLNRRSQLVWVLASSGLYSITWRMISSKTHFRKQPPFRGEFSPFRCDIASCQFVHGSRVFIQSNK